MTNSQIIEQNYDLIKRCVDYQFSKKRDSLYYEYKEDLLQDICLTLLEYDNDKMNEMNDNKHLNAFITRIIRNNIYSTSSPFYVNYIKNNAKKYHPDNDEQQAEEEYED